MFLITNLVPILFLQNFHNFHYIHLVNNFLFLHYLCKIIENHFMIFFVSIFILNFKNFVIFVKKFIKFYHFQDFHYLEKIHRYLVFYYLLNLYAFQDLLFLVDYPITFNFIIYHNFSYFH
jgi:hypothetical protein